MLILLGCGFLLSELLRPSRDKQKTGVRAHDRHTENDPPIDSTEKANSIQRSTCQSGPHSMRAGREVHKEVHKPDTAYHDSSAQRCNKQKHWLDYAVFFASLFAAGSALVAAVFTGCQAWIAKEELNASQRPWVRVELIDHGGVGIGEDFRFAFRLHNYGRTPAVRVHITPTGVLWQPGAKPNVSETQKKMCELGSMEPPMGLGPYVLFPDQVHVENSGIDLFSQKAVAQKSFNGAIFPYITGCITYRSTFDDTIHRTPFAIQITRRGVPDAKDNSPELNAAMIDRMPIPANMISLRSESPQGMQPD